MATAESTINSSIRPSATITPSIITSRSWRRSELHDVRKSICISNLPAEAQSEGRRSPRAKTIQGRLLSSSTPVPRARKNFGNARRWAEVDQSLTTARACRCVLTGGSSPLEQAHIAEIKAHLQRSNPRSFRQTRFAHACGVDRQGSAARHESIPRRCISPPRGTPQVVLFGPTNPFHWRPRSTSCCRFCRAGSTIR